MINSTTIRTPLLIEQWFVKTRPNCVLYYKHLYIINIHKCSLALFPTIDCCQASIVFVQWI